MFKSIWLFEKKKNTEKSTLLIPAGNIIVVTLVYDIKFTSGNKRKKQKYCVWVVTHGWRESEFLHLISKNDVQEWWFPDAAAYAWIGG